jgi:hypothetical protein
MTHNLAVDADAQLRMLPTVAPVGRRSLLRYSGGSRLSPPQGICGLRAPRPFRTGRSVGPRRPRLVAVPRTAASFLLVRVHRHSLAPRPGRAEVLSSAVAVAARFTLSARSFESEGSRSRLPQARSGVGRCGPLNLARRALGVRQEPRHNLPVDSDAQLRMLPAVAPVGRRSPSR